MIDEPAAPGRLLTSTKLRAALYLAAGGKCQLCGVELGPGWHADHIAPWCVTKDTNVHEMQALCPACNLRKGSTMSITLREHQGKLEQRGKDIAAGELSAVDTLIAVTPGGGKSLASVLFADALYKSGHVNRVMFVVPNDNLRRQMESAVAEAGKGWQVRAAGNEPPLVRDGAIGYVTTYQSIASFPRLHTEAMRMGGRWLVVLDEFHHVADDEHATWKGAIAPIVEKAKHVLYMTGTPERHDGKPLPFVDSRYVDNGEGRTILQPDVEYRLRDALRENAVIPARFAWNDARVSWSRAGQPELVTADISQVDERTRSAALVTFLDKCGAELLDKCLADWASHRRLVNREAQCLVIAPDQRRAREYAQIARSSTGESVALAISDENQSQRALDRFRRRKGTSILVTVAMASEGFDAPGVSHLAMLTQVRSRPWLLQAVARATRIDRLHSKPQRACVFCPDDPLMRDFVAWMEAEQSEGVAAREKLEREAAEADRSQSLSNVIPHSGELTGVRFDELDTNKSAMVGQVLMLFPELAHLPSERLAASALQLASSLGTKHQPRQLPAPEPETLSQREARLRKECEVLARRCDHAHEWQNGEANKRAFRHFDKSRKEMSCSELEQVVRYFQRLAAAAA